MLMVEVVMVIVVVVVVVVHFTLADDTVCIKRHSICVGAITIR